MGSDRAKLFIRTMMNIAHEMTAMSTCQRGQHACVLVSRDRRILATGYNGPASRLPNRCHRPDEPGRCGCVHAEANAVVQPRLGDPHFAFITAAPCESCAQLLVNAGVRYVVYATVTSQGHAGLDVLTQAGVGYSLPSVAHMALMLPSG